MKITPIKTDKIIPNQAPTILKFLDKANNSLEENSILAITSKIVAICEGATQAVSSTTRQSLIEQEADYFLPASQSKYDLTLTVKDSILIPSAGIDTSNGMGYFVLWPRSPQRTANIIRQHFKQKYQLKKFGVIITDSRTTPLRRGTTGVALVHSGFQALHNYIGEPDIFGEPLKVSQANIMDGLAAVAVMVMGEGSEQTPLAVITELSFVNFTTHNPTKEELDNLRIDPADDLYGPIIQAVKWQKGKK